MFSASSDLQQNALEDDLQNDDDLLSPTLQTQELASIEELASPELDDTAAAELEDEPQAAVADQPIEAADEESSGVDAPLDAEDSNPDAPIVDSPAEVAQDAEVDSPTEVEEEAALEALTPEQLTELVAEAVASESSDELQFDAPTDEWTQLLSEIEHSTEEPPGADDETSASDQDSPDGEAEAGRQAERYRDVGAPAASGSWTEIEMSGEEHISHERVAVGEAETALATDEPIGDVRSESDVSALLDAEQDISADQVDAALSADPDPDLVEALEVGLPSKVAGAKRSTLWTAGSAAMTLALAFQVIHHFRAPLASQSLVGPLVRGAYGILGAELVPEWDLDQYEILNWIATEAGVGNLRITAQIRNNGPRTQPYPYIHLELKDRWEAVVGSRVFEPVEYLQPDADLSDLMVAGATVPADFAVVDPGEDAYGFELDVCIQRGADQLSCSSQRVFE